MNGLRVDLPLKALCCLAALVLSGCGSEAEDAPAPAAAIAKGPVDPNHYAGEVRFKLAEPLPVGGRELPLTLYLGLSPQSATRLAVEAFVDLRPLQQALPEIVAGTVVESCGLGLDLDLDRVEAVGTQVRGRGRAVAHLYRCPGRGTEQERRGMRLLSQTIDVIAVATAGVEQDCIVFRLEELELAPKGLIGRLADLFGVTGRAREAILDRAGEALASRPICPDLPEDVAWLDPRYTDGGPREIGDGGMGAALSGSVDASAGSLVRLVDLARSRGILGGVR
ncbi:MAG TPA: hypothetical protein PKA33_02155 [Amaricoccus sp.]|uniref:hypothetical protein n=1 Tax=Amaricoccus sp. TaxID=1872485 RepID=UPI002BEFCD23|nr:hypothetical protein [Amaricoccus sp.]HMQ91567.1 hypothetical protein [Amaricoccus sp.]HMR51101.1 hypothetical protein [Amaricoccus sp.]HMT98151.1 hypothetical protein [Amaricoccus sp.]